MFHFLGIVLIAVTALSVVLFVLQMGAPTRRAVFLLPHQDDEMFMAGSIERALADGKDVSVAIVTDGGASSVLPILNGDRYSTLDHRYHYPRTEGYVPLTRQTFSAARNRELSDSLQALGVRPDHILFLNAGGLEGSSDPVYRDGELTEVQAREAIQEIFRVLGDGEYATVAAALGDLNQTHGDHFALRQALRNFSGIKTKWYFSERPGLGTAVPLSVPERRNKFLALAAYFLWQPESGRFAVGKHSVLDLLSAWRESKTEYIFDNETIRALDPSPAG